MYIRRILNLQAVTLTVLLGIVFADESSNESTRKGPQRTGLLIRQLKPTIRRQRPNSDESCETCSSKQNPLPPSPDIVSIRQNIATENFRHPLSNSNDAASGCDGGGVLQMLSCRETGKVPNKKTEEIIRALPKSSSGVGGALRNWIIDRDDPKTESTKKKENGLFPNAQVEDTSSGISSMECNDNSGDDDDRDPRCRPMQRAPGGGQQMPGGRGDEDNVIDSDEIEGDIEGSDTDYITPEPTLDPVLPPTLLPPVLPPTLLPPVLPPTLLPPVAGCPYPRKDHQYSLKNSTTCFTEAFSTDASRCMCQKSPPCIGFKFPVGRMKMKQNPLANIPIMLQTITDMSEIVGLPSNNIDCLHSGHFGTAVLTLCVLVYFITWYR